MRKRRLRIFPVICLALIVVSFIALVSYLIWSLRQQDYPVEYEQIVQSVSVEQGVPEHIIYAVIYTESSFVPDAVSTMGAIGLMQILPDTAEWLAKREGIEYSDKMLTDPEYNIRLGTKYLKILYDKYSNWDAAHAAYHAGFSRVDSWLSEGIASFNTDGQLTGIPIDSTSNYVNKIRLVREKYFKQLEKMKKD